MPKKRKTKADLEAELAAAEESKKKQKTAIGGVAKEFVCPISLDLPVEPVTASDGRVYNRADIQRHIDSAKREGKEILSPVTKEKLDEKLLPAVQVTNTIRTLIESGAVEGELADQWKEVDEMKTDAMNGDTTAMVVLGHWCHGGLKGFQQDFKKTYAWYEKTANLDDLRGITWQGEALIYGKGVECNVAHGMILITSAAERGFPSAAYILGYKFYHGEFVPQSRKLAKYWLNKALGKAKDNVWNLSVNDKESAEEMMAELDSKD